MWEVRHREYTASTIDQEQNTSADGRSLSFGCAVVTVLATDMPFLQHFEIACCFTGVFVLGFPAVENVR